MEYSEVARLMQEALPVLRPSPDFREALGYRLLLAAEDLLPEAGQSFLQERLTQTIRPRVPARGLLLGTAAVSLVGAVFFLWRSKGVQGTRDLALAAAAGE